MSLKDYATNQFFSTLKDYLLTKYENLQSDLLFMYWLPIVHKNTVLYT